MLIITSRNEIEVWITILDLYLCNKKKKIIALTLYTIWEVGSIVNEDDGTKEDITARIIKAS